MVAGWSENNKFGGWYYVFLLCVYVLYVYVCICMYMYVYVCKYVYIYIYWLCLIISIHISYTCRHTHVLRKQTTQHCDTNVPHLQQPFVNGQEQWIDLWGGSLLFKWWLTCLSFGDDYKYVTCNRRKFRSQTSDNMDRWKAEMRRVREKRGVEERRVEERKIREETESEERRCRCAKR